MTPTTDETAGGRGGDGEGLCGSAMNASAEVGLGRIMARKRPDPPSIQQKRYLRMLGSAIESSARPTAVVGRKPSGKSRFNAVAAEVAAKHGVPVIGLHACVLEQVKAAGDEAVFMEDGVHFTEDMKKKQAAFIAKRVREIVGGVGKER